MEKKEFISVNKLFDRPPQISYLEEWERLLSETPPKIQEIKETSMIVFRLSKEWFALPTLVFSEISVQRNINSIPYTHDPTILGVVNLQGQLRLCFSLHDLLGIQKNTEDESPSTVVRSYYPRLLAITDETQLWTFPVEEVESVYQFDLSKMANIPVTLLRSDENYLKGIIILDERKIYIINEEPLFNTLRRRML